MVERNPSFLALRLAGSLEWQNFTSTSRSKFSDLSRLTAAGERSFSRVSLEKQLVQKISSAIREGYYCVVVGGPGGIGKSVFWEALFQKRPPHSPLWGSNELVWAPLPGPTRVVNLLKCKDLSAFEAQVIDTCVPEPFLPSFGLSSPPSFEKALDVLEKALWVLSIIRSKESLIIYIEDINRLASFAGWQDRFVPFASTVASNGNGIIVGNSSSLLAYLKFEALPHTGLRTSKFFFPTLSRKSDEFVEFLNNGGHLFKPGYQGAVSRPSIYQKSDAWNGNLSMLKHGTCDDEDAIRVRITQCLTDVQVFNNSETRKWKDLVSDGLPPQKILDLRRQLLKLIEDSPDHSILVRDLPSEIRACRIVEQLAAIDLVTFRTVEDHLSDNESVIVAPYHPAVMQQFKRVMAEGLAV